MTAHGKALAKHVDSHVDRYPLLAPVPSRACTGTLLTRRPALLGRNFTGLLPSGQSTTTVHVTNIYHANSPHGVHACLPAGARTHANAARVAMVPKQAPLAGLAELHAQLDDDPDANRDQAHASDARHDLRHQTSVMSPQNHTATFRSRQPPQPMTGTSTEHKAIHSSMHHLARASCCQAASLIPSLFLSTSSMANVRNHVLSLNNQTM